MKEPVVSFLVGYLHYTNVPRLWLNRDWPEIKSPVASFAKSFPLIDFRVTPESESRRTTRLIHNRTRRALIITLHIHQFD